MTKHTIVILGGGVGGLTAANELRRLLPSPYRIVLVEQHRLHSFAPSFLWVMTGDRQSKAISRPVDGLVRSDVEIVQAEVTAIDLERRSVTTPLVTLSYDYLVIALGAELSPGTVPGLPPNAHSFYTLDGAVRLNQAVEQFDKGKIAVVVCSVPYKCPGAPHEGAMLLADLVRRRGRADTVEIHLYTPESRPMPVAGPELGEAVKAMLASKKVSFHPSHMLSSIDSENRLLMFEGKEPVGYDLLVAIPPHRAPRVVQEAGLTNQAGWIPVDRSTLATKHERVYAIGDITAIGIPGRWKPEVPLMLPKAGVFAHVQAEVVAQRIADEVNGRSSTTEFCGSGYCMLEAGEGLAGFAFGDFFAEPAPRLEVRDLGRAWHAGKVLFEQWWLSPFGIRRSVLRHIINLGCRIMRIPVRA